MHGVHLVIDTKLINRRVGWNVPEGVPLRGSVEPSQDKRAGRLTRGGARAVPVSSGVLTSLRRTGCPSQVTTSPLRIHSGTSCTPPNMTSLPVTRKSKEAAVSIFSVVLYCVIYVAWNDCVRPDSACVTRPSWGVAGDAGTDWLSHLTLPTLRAYLSR